jgi:hypothetical protein
MGRFYVKKTLFSRKSCVFFNCFTLGVLEGVFVGVLAPLQPLARFLGVFMISASESVSTSDDVFPLEPSSESEEHSGL